MIVKTAVRGWLLPCVGVCMWMKATWKIHLSPSMLYLSFYLGSLLYFFFPMGCQPMLNASCVHPKPPSPPTDTVTPTIPQHPIPSALTEQLLHLGASILLLLLHPPPASEPQCSNPFPTKLPAGPGARSRIHIPAASTLVSRAVSRSRNRATAVTRVGSKHSQI